MTKAATLEARLIEARLPATPKPTGEGGPATPKPTGEGGLIPLAGADDERVAGGKARVLARLMRLDVPVPDGMVLTSGAFAAFLSAACLEGPIHRQLATIGATADPAALDAASAAIRALVMDAPLPADIEEALGALSATPLGTGALAVRSSAIGEDGTGSSFAGQFDSVLHVHSTAGLRDAVRTCWASYWSARALFYRQSRNLPAAGMAVVIQRQVPAVVAGVLFTRCPGETSGSGDDMVVEYCAGLADRLVSGEVDPGRLYISRDTLAVTRELEDDADGADRLTGRHLEDLARTALRLEQALGGPQDVEWAVGADDRLWIVQSRRITTPVAGADRQATVLWSNANVSENFPEPVSPLLYSIASAGYYHYFRNLGLAFGVSRRRLGAMDSAFRTIIGVHGARIYYNLSNIHAVLRLAPCGERLADAFNLFVGAAEKAQDPTRERPSRRHPVGQALELVRIAAAVTWQFAFLERRLRRFENAADAFAGRTAHESLEPRSLAGLGSDLAAFIEIRCHKWKDASLCDTAAMVCYALLRRVLARGGFGDATHTRLLRALPGVPSSQPALRLWELSRRIRANHHLLVLFRDKQASDVLAAVRHDPELGAFRRELDAFLTSWGFRSSGELMLTMPTLEEEPEPVIALLRQYVSVEGASPEDTMLRQADERRAETSAVLRHLSTRAPHLAVPTWLLLRCTQRAIAARERARLKQALLYTRCRRVALRIGDALVREHRLASANDVFMLTWQEIDELCAGRAMFPTDVAALVALRRAQHAAASRLDPPDTIRLAESAAFGSGLADDASQHGAGTAGPAEAGHYVRSAVGPAEAGHYVRSAVGPAEAGHYVRSAVGPAEAGHYVRSAVGPAEAGHYVRSAVGPAEAGHYVQLGIPADPETLRGATACGGRVSARAAVLAGVHESHRLQRGDILVTKQTDPGWAPVFCLVSGLVIERGGMLSHGAIIAREFGLPCVVGVKAATARIPHGSLLTVDADQGTCHVEAAS